MWGQRSRIPRRWWQWKPRITVVWKKQIRLDDGEEVSFIAIKCGVKYVEWYGCIFHLSLVWCFISICILHLFCQFREGDLAPPLQSVAFAGCTFEMRLEHYSQIVLDLEAYLCRNEIAIHTTHPKRWYSTGTLPKWSFGVGETLQFTQIVWEKR